MQAETPEAIETVELEADELASNSAAIDLQPPPRSQKFMMARTMLSLWLPSS